MFKGKKGKIWSLAAKFKYFCVQNRQSMYFLLSFFSFNLISLKLDKWVAMYVNPLGVKKTQEICSMVTESLIKGH